MLRTGPLHRPNGNLDSQNMAQNRFRSEQFNNFPAQTTRKLTKSGLNGNRFYKVLIQISLSEENQKSGLNKETFLKCPELGTMS